MKLMRLVITLSAALAVLGATRPARANLKVVATVPDLAALARTIGGSKIKVTSLALETQDPHFVDAKPSLVLRVNRADMLVAVGASLEVGWLPTLQNAARNGKIRVGGSGYLDCSRHVSLRNVMTGQVSRSQGDIHPSGNPHYLYAPASALRCARAIADRMAKLDPGNAAEYAANFKRFSTSLLAKKKAWETRMAFARGKPIIIYHDSWRYLSGWLGLREVVSVEPKPGVPPSPRHVLHVILTGRRTKAKIVLQEAFYPSKTGRLVAKKVGATFVKLPGGAAFRKGETYLQHMDHAVAALEQALR